MSILCKQMLLGVKHCAFNYFVEAILQYFNLLFLKVQAALSTFMQPCAEELASMPVFLMGLEIKF